MAMHNRHDSEPQGRLLLIDGDERHAQLVAETLAQSLGKDINTLSHGYRQRVGLGQALVHDPPILILDEPTSALDDQTAERLTSAIATLKEHRTTFLISHRSSILRLADRTFRLDGPVGGDPSGSTARTLEPTQ